MCLLRAAFVTFLFSATVLAQGYGSISGVVVDGENRPVDRAVVTLSTTGAHPQDAVAWTDEAGRFGFAYLPPGAYELHALKPALGAATFGTRTRSHPSEIIHVQAGENRSDLVCRLGVSNGSISGTVFDENGDPLPNAPLRVLQQSRRRGMQGLFSIYGAQTDSQGHYRISNLFPGSYIVCSQPFNRGQQLARSEVSAKQTAQFTMSSEQCYPGTDGPKEASPIVVHIGKEVAGIDVHVAVRPAVQLHGRVQLPPDFDANRNSINVIALAGDDNAGGMRRGTAVNPRTLEFQLPPLPSGAFTLVARTDINGKQYRGVQKITSTGQSGDEIVITLLPGVSLSGTAKVVGPDVAQHTLEYVALVPGEDIAAQGSPRAHVKQDGTFTIESVAPGVWDIDVGPVPRGGYVKSIMFGKQDVLTEQMRITRDAPASLDIVVATDGATVKGQVVDGADQPGYGRVLLAPEGKGRDVFAFYRWAQVDDLGQFEFSGVRPGTYNLYAFADFETGTDWPEGLTPFAHDGVRINVDEGKTLTQKLKIIEGQTGAKP